MRRAMSDGIAGGASPEDDDGPLEAVGGRKWERAGVDLDQLVLVHRDVEAPMCGKPVAERHRERQVVGRQDLPELVERPELRSPLLPPEPADLLEAPSDQLPRGVVEEDQ